VGLVLVLTLWSLPAAETALEHFQAGRLPEGLALLPPLVADPPAGQAAARRAALVAALPQLSRILIGSDAAKHAAALEIFGLALAELEAPVWQANLGFVAVTWLRLEHHEGLRPKLGTLRPALIARLLREAHPSGLQTLVQLSSLCPAATGEIQTAVDAVLTVPLAGADPGAHVGLAYLIAAVAERQWAEVTRAHGLLRPAEGADPAVNRVLALVDGICRQAAQAVADRELGALQALDREAVGLAAGSEWFAPLSGAIRGLGVETLAAALAAAEDRTPALHAALADRPGAVAFWDGLLEQVAGVAISGGERKYSRLDALLAAHDAAHPQVPSRRYRFWLGLAETGPVEGLDSGLDRLGCYGQAASAAPGPAERSVALEGMLAAARKAGNWAGARSLLTAHCPEAERETWFARLAAAEAEVGAVAAREAAQAERARRQGRVEHLRRTLERLRAAAAPAADLAAVQAELQAAEAQLRAADAGR
jgi:hypothetical protein